MFDIGRAVRELYLFAGKYLWRGPPVYSRKSCVAVLPDVRNVIFLEILFVLFLKQVFSDVR